MFLSSNPSKGKTYLFHISAIMLLKGDCGKNWIFEMYVVMVPWVEGGGSGAMLHVTCCSVTLPQIMMDTPRVANIEYQVNMTSYKNSIWSLWSPHLQNSDPVCCLLNIIYLNWANCRNLHYQFQFHSKDGGCRL